MNLNIPSKKSYRDALLSYKNIETLERPIQVNKSNNEKNKNIETLERPIQVNKSNNEKNKNIECYYCLNNIFNNLNKIPLLYFESIEEIENNTKKYNNILKNIIICLKCQNIHMHKCLFCNNLFHINSIIDAWDDKLLTKCVKVCKQCFSYEACTQCKYLGGSNPCKWCRGLY